MRAIFTSYACHCTTIGIDEIHGDWAGVWEGIKQTASGVWNAIQGLVKYGLELIRLAIERHDRRSHFETGR